MLPVFSESFESELRATQFGFAKSDCGRQHYFFPRRGTENGDILLSAKGREGARGERGKF